MDKKLHLNKSVNEDKPIPVLEPRKKLQISPHDAAADSKQPSSQMTHLHVVKPPKTKQDEYLSPEKEDDGHTAVRQAQENKYNTVKKQVALVQQDKKPRTLKQT